MVEDNLDAAQMLKVALELEGHEVRLAFDGRDAIEAVKAFRPMRSCLTSDYPASTAMTSHVPFASFPDSRMFFMLP